MADRLTLLCVHPHPDDESISCGGVLARASDEGIHTVVVTCTGGEEGENLAGIELGDEDLVSHRRRELAAALAALGVAEHEWLGYRDSGMAGSPANHHPESFHTADTREAALRLAAIVRRVRPDVVVSDDQNGTYGHPDHIKANRVTAAAVALAADPDAQVVGEPWQVAKRYVHALSRERLAVGHRELLEAGLASPFGAEVEEALEFGIPEDQITTQVDVTPWQGRKRAAMAAHRSQIGEDSFFLNLPENVGAHFFGVEEFVRQDHDGHDGASNVGPETDLFAGLRPDGPASTGR